MTDPNLEKIVNNNILDIEKGFLGRTITQASSYLDYVYGYHNRDKRKIELSDFVEALKLTSDRLKIKKSNDNGVKNVPKQRQQQRQQRTRRN
jgi:hypothetical protein